jgi:hypothetical protein
MTGSSPPAITLQHQGSPLPLQPQTAVHPWNEFTRSSLHSLAVEDDDHVTEL